MSPSFRPWWSPVLQLDFFEVKMTHWSLWIVFQTPLKVKDNFGAKEAFHMRAEMMDGISQTACKSGGYE